MNRFGVWVLSAAIAAGAGCASNNARAQEPRQPAPDAPVAPEAPTARRAYAQAAQEDAARASEEARRAAEAGREAAEEGRRAAAEVREKLRSERGLLRLSQKKEKAAFLGVTTSPVPGALREQMKLPRGFGLVVDTVDKESAAGEAGVQQYDILQKLNDQLLVNSQQLGVLIRSMKPGEQVSLTLLRGGQPQTLNATLKEKEVPVLSEGSWDVEVPFGAIAAVAPTPQIGQLNWTPDGERDVFRFFNTAEDETSSVYQDGEMTLTITEEGEEKTLVAKNAAGDTLFDGPIASEEQRTKLPKDVSEKLKKFESRIKSIKVDGKKVRLKVVEP